jgi:hypothetical protein
MTILGFQTENIGQAGQSPSFIYINTNDDIDTVSTNGYLNGIVAQGNQLSEYNMALVATKTNPGSKSTGLDLFNVVFSGGDWTLTQIATGTITGVTSIGGGQPLFPDQPSGETVIEFFSLEAGIGIELNLGFGSIQIQVDPTAALNFTNASIDAVTLNIGNTLANTINIGNSTTSAINILEVPIGAVTLGPAMHIPPDGYNYLCINATTGTLAQFVP